MRKRQKKNSLKKRTKDHSKHRTAAAAVLLILSAALMAASVKIPAFAEWYSETIYPFLVNTAGRIMGTAPFSVAELCLYLLLAALAVSIVYCAGKIVKGAKAGNVLFSWFSGVILAVGILAFLYTAGCGINYHRRSFSAEEGIVTSFYSSEELNQVCIWLTAEVNAACEEVSRDDAGVMILV